MAELTSLTFTVYGVAAPKGSARAFYVKKLGRAVVTAANANTKPWAQAVTGMALASRTGEVMDGAVSLRVNFYLPRPKSLPKKATTHTKKPDVDKLARSICDALTGVIWRDDSQVVDLGVGKYYAGGVYDPDGAQGVPRAVITVKAEQEQA